jgi:sugar phosphate isomerase/epimerase
MASTMQLGIFARTFDGDRIEPLLDAAAAHGLRHIHFNLKCVGVPTIPETIDETLCRNIHSAFQKRGMKMVALSATFNAIDPDKALRRQQTRRTSDLIRACKLLGTDAVSLCTGTRDPADMWRHHPENASPAAWNDLVETLEELLPVAEAENVVLGIEPEVANVIDSARKARRLLDQLRSPCLKIIFDAANLFWPDKLENMTATLEEAVDLLGPDIAMAHAKDITGDEAKKQQAAGTGRLDWPTLFRLLKRARFDGPLILHNLKSSQVDAAAAFIRAQAAPWYPELANKADR